MDQGHAHSSGSEDVTWPMLRVEVKDTKSSTDEEARKTGGISREMQSSTEDSSKSIDVEEDWIIEASGNGQDARADR
jgi:hypothetical protein